ncbi:MAG TPA: hypothetical protein VLV50_12120 [Stellaceae bacterium]|nr:hypothetical protein [Stellaceae bacterium]
MRGYWRAWGLRLALVALALQAAVPLFILVDLRALAAEQAADAIAGQALCIHDGSSHPAAPAHSCSLSVCPLCAAIAAASALGVPATAALPPPPLARAAPALMLAAAAALRETQSLPYRSRAPPAV